MTAKLLQSGVTSTLTVINSVWTIASVPSNALIVGTPVVASATKNDPSASYDVTIDITSGVESTCFTKKAISG